MLSMHDNVFKKAAIVFFALLFITGCFIFDDYGISTDEEVQRISIGEWNYNFIKNGDAAHFLQNHDNYHGPAFELFLYSAEKIFNVTDSRHIYILRHGLIFLLFFVSALFFYFLSLRIFKYHVFALLGVLMLVLSPRIFAESFYNSKDMTLLCFCIISTYSMLVFVDKQTIVSALIHATCCGITIDIRIMGLLIPIATVYLFLFQIQKRIIPFLIFLTYTCVSVILFWPVLWLGPLHHFIRAFIEMSKYPGNGFILYMGKFVPIQNLPWHYLPVWISITIPVCYLLLFIAGVFFMLKNTLASFRKTVPVQTFFFVFASPIIAVIVLHSTVYDSWRHVYFVYPFFVIIAVYGFTQLVSTVKSKITLKSVFAFIIISVMSVLFFMINNHPFQNVYFNFLAGNNIRQNYELDYWGLSYRKALEYILTHDNSDTIKITSDRIDVDLTSLLNFQILPQNQRSRLVFEDNIYNADYFVTNFRWHPQDYNIGSSVYEIKVGNEKIMEVVKLK